MKETYYFDHDYNSTQDPKIMKLISECGLSGLGMYWILVEIMHQQENGSLPYDSFKGFLSLYYSFDGGRGKELLIKIEKCFFDTELFFEQNGFVQSKRILKHKNFRNSISEKRSKAGKIGAKNRLSKSSALVEQVLNNKKERKGKERKGKTITLKNNFQGINRNEIKFKKEDMDKITEAYKTIKGINPQGREWLPIQQSIKTMFLSGRSPDEIIDCMKFFANSKKECWQSWTIDTVKKQIPLFLSGKL